jgi:hypothetical protein
MSNSGLRTIGWILLLVGLVLVVIGIVYFTVAADKLPSILGKVATSTRHRDKRGIAALALGVILWIGATVAFARAGRRRVAA